VVASRIASGRALLPRLMASDPLHAAEPLGVPQAHLDLIRAAMTEMVNGRGTGARARLPLADIKLAGKSGTAQVVGLNIGTGKGGAWKRRDHGHFICFAPADKPRFACSVLVEHGGGSGAAMPVARDVMTYLFDRKKAWDALLPLEAEWGGTPQQRMARKYASYAAQYGVNVPRVGDSDSAIAKAQGSASEAPSPVAEATEAAEPSAEVASPAPAPAPSPSATGGQ
jgi:penicillin-binding protein 2